MKRLSLLLILIVLCATSYAQKFFFEHGVKNTVLFSQDRPVVRERTFENFDQNLDHFNPTNTDTFKQRYLVNADYFNNNTEKRVVFLYVEGEAEAAVDRLDRGLWRTLAPEYGALLVALEHRYYGESQPYSNVTSENLQYLSSQQALADIANFIQYINQKYAVKSDVKWFLFGGSYPGNLVAWARLKYPHLVYASVASSAPVLSKLNFREYHQVVIDNMRNADQECVNTVQKGVEQINDIIKTNGTRLKELFNICDDVDFNNLKEKEISMLQQNIAAKFAINSLYDNQKGYSMNNTCATLNNDTTLTEIERLGALIRDDQSCSEINYNVTIDAIKNTEFKTGLGARQWFYQLCTELEVFHSFDQDTPIFGTTYTVDYWVDYCNDLFPYISFNKTMMNKIVNNTNTVYGGVDIPTDRILYVLGSVDPWHPIGKLNTTNNASPVLYVKGGSHGADMNDIQDTDSDEMRDAKYFILNQLKEWIIN